MRPVMTFSVLANVRGQLYLHVHLNSCTLAASPAFPSPPQPLDSPILLNLVHPYALLNLTGALDYVKSFRTFLGSQTPRGENAQIARDVFVDLVDCSGIDLSVLVPLLRESVPDAMNIGSE